MSKTAVTILLCLLPFLGICQKIPQSLSFSQIISYYNSDHSSINDILLAKGWDFEEATKETSEEYGTVTWAYRTNKGSATAQAFFELSISNDEILRVRYQCSKPEIINAIKSQIASNKMNQVKSGIFDDGSIYTDYTGANYAVRIETGKDMIGNRLFQVHLYGKDYYFRHRYLD